LSRLVPRRIAIYAESGINLNLDYIAESVGSFLADIGTEIDENEAIHLGFTFRLVRIDIDL
jgi:hexokinase